MAAERVGGSVYETRGEGPPVVLIHGLGLNRHMWDWFVDAFSANHQVVTFDLLGHGDSDKPVGPYRMAQFTDQIAELCTHLKLGPVALAGFSLGGIINRAMALAHPDMVRAIAVVNSYHDRTDAQREAVMKRVDQAREHGPTATVEAALERWFTPEFGSAHPEVLDQVRQWVTANDAQVYPHLYHLMAACDADYVTSVADIRCPALIIASADDPGNTPAMAEAMGAVIPNARVEVLPGLRHMGLSERPEDYYALIEPFFAESFASAAG